MADNEPPEPTEVGEPEQFPLPSTLMRQRHLPSSNRFRISRRLRAAGSHTISFLFSH